MADDRRAALADELVEALSTVRRRLRAAARPSWPGGPLTGAEVEVVRLVRREPGTSISDAARRLGVAPNTVSTLARGLVDRGWLDTERDPDDRRVVRMTLRPAARRRIERWRDTRTARVEAALDRLPRRQRDDLARALPALLALADELDDGGRR